MRKINRKGFTLVEILAAIAILGVLMALATTAYNTYKKKARQQAYDTMAKSATAANTNYLMENATKKYITLDELKEQDYIDTLQDPRYKELNCKGIVINKVVPGETQKKLGVLFQKVKLCCKNYKYQYDYTGEEVKVTEIENCDYVDGDEIDGVYKLIYKPQGGSSCDPPVVMKKQNEEWGPLCVTTRENYVFKGWNTKRNGNGSTITEHTTVDDHDINVFAIWNSIHELTYNEEGGSVCNPKTISKEKGEKWGTLCTTTKSGHAFKGWNTKKDGTGSKITNNTYVEKNLNVYAVWNPFYTLTYDSQGGTACVPNTITEEKGEKWGTLCSPTKTGYAFTEWNTQSDGKGTKITANSTVNGNIKVYAIWNPKYTLTYNSNGGSTCNPATLTQENGQAWGTLCQTTRNGYKFNGWKDTSGNVITKDTICRGNLTVTAQWGAKGYTLSYNSDGGSACTATSGKYDQAWGTLCSPTKTGHDFGGWFDGTTPVNASTICKGDRSVKASWTKKNYVLTFAPNGGSACNPATITKPYNDAWGTLCQTTRTGYTLAGWFDGTTQIEATTKATKTFTATASWVANSYTLTYNNNGGSGCTSKKGTYDSTWGTLCTPTKAGYKFTGWYDNGVQVNSSTKVVGNRSVTAQWSEITYTLSYDDNGGSNCTGKTIVKAENVAWGTLCTPSRAGYTFDGWKNGSTTVTSTSKATADITVKASWTKENYTLTYNSNGGSACSPTSITKPYNEAWGTLCSPTRTGYDFAGWKNGSTTVTSTSKATSSITVKASWTAKTYTLTYNNNGGSGCSTKTGSYGGTWGTLCTPSRSGYTFDGWKNSSGSFITSSTSVSGNLSVTAQWSSAEPTVTLVTTGKFMVCPCDGEGEQNRANRSRDCHNDKYYNRMRLNSGSYNSSNGVLSFTYTLCMNDYNSTYSGSGVANLCVAQKGSNVTSCYSGSLSTYYYNKNGWLAKGQCTSPTSVSVDLSNYPSGEYKVIAVGQERFAFSMTDYTDVTYFTVH